MDRELEATFIEAVDALEAGESLEAILERYPQQADDLRLLLETAAALSKVPVAYSAAARKNSRAALLQRAADLRERPRRPAIISWWRRFALTFGSLALLLIIVGGLLVGPAGAALPGDALYPLKVAGEEVRLATAGSATQREVLRERFRRERVAEINALLTLGREADVSCYGNLEAIEAGAWLLDGLRVEITAGTEIEGEARAGVEVEGTCRVAGGQVTAVTMRVQSLPEAPPPPTPSPTATMEPAATDTPTPTTTVTATPAPTPEPTEALAPTPPPAATTIAPPAGEPGDDDGDDDRGDDDGDDEGGDDEGGDDEDDDDNSGSDDGDDDESSDDGDDEESSDDGDDDDVSDDGDDD